MAQLKKVIGYPVLLLIIVNSIMGTGIFFLPAAGALVAGPASILSWIILAIFSIYIAMCFGELTSMFPTAGGVYEFCKQAYGRTVSFFIGWLTLIGGNITIAMLVIGAISYLLPPNLPQLKIAIILISALFILIFNVIAYRGMKTSATMLVTFACITLGTILSLMVPSLFKFEFSNLTPFLAYGSPAIFLAIFFIAETFFGWEAPTFLAAETKNGREVVPKALVHGTIFISIFSLVFVFLTLGSLGYLGLGQSSAPLSTLGGFLYGEFGRVVYMLLVYLAVIGSVAGWVVSSPRLILSMSNDKLFLPGFDKIHSKFHTPSNAIILQFVLSIVFIFLGLGSYTTLLHMLVPILIVLYSFVMLAVVILRFKRPNLKRYYTVPFGKVGPIIVVLFFLGLLIAWLTLVHDALPILIKGLLLMFMGIPIYFLLEMYYNPKFIRFTEDIFAYLTLWTERLALPIKVRRQIVTLLGNLKGKAVLEFGCSVGTLTLHLAEEVGRDGKIYATSLSAKEVKITQNRAYKKGMNHITVLHDDFHSSRVHPDIPNIHSVVSVGSLSYLQDVDTVLKQMNKRLKKGSKICFVEYDKFFDIIPSLPWLSSDKKIQQIFHKAGFNISIIRKQGFAWKYIFIYGVKIKEIPGN